MNVLFDRLQHLYGLQHWWPAETPFEIMVGAVLIQNTSWTNAESAIGRLKEAEVLNPEALLGLSLNSLAALLRPVGYFNLKASRLLNFVGWYCENGGFQSLNLLETPVLREALLNVKGIGPETADDILLYAFSRPVFVVDAYTRRVFGRLGCLFEDAPYECLRAAFEEALPPNPDLYGEYHALIVAHAKKVCRSRPSCEKCGLNPDCPTGQNFLAS